jgi:putative Holliday junction resolvase
MTVLGIDYGRRRVGVAVSDEEEIVAHLLPTLHRSRSDRGLFHALRRIAEAQGVRAIVVGLPQHMNGSLGEMAAEARTFADRLRAELGLPTTMIDERLTSVEADRVLRESNAPPAKRRQLRDGIAAVLILQAYLEKERSGR